MAQERPRATWRETRRLISADIDLHSTWPLKYGLIKPSRPRLLLFLYLFFTIHMFPAVFIYRLQCFTYDAGLPPLATFLSRLNHWLFGVTIGNQVRSTGALLIAHGHVVLDGWTLLGDRVHINPFVTLGISNSGSRPSGLWGPTVGDHVNIGTGAKIVGKVTIGDYALIGANAVVIDDVPAHHTAVGSPARSFPSRENSGQVLDTGAL